MVMLRGELSKTIQSGIQCMMLLMECWRSAARGAGVEQRESCLPFSTMAALSSITSGHASDALALRLLAGERTTDASGTMLT